MYETAILAIQKYVDECLPTPLLCWPKDEFDRRSYSRWIVDEILERIIEEASRPPQFITGRESITPIDIIGELILELNYYEDISEDKRTRLIFSVAKETASDIILLFL